MKTFIKDKWFQLIVILFLVLIFIRLGNILKMTERVWDQGNADSMNITRAIQDSASDLMYSIERLEQ